MLGAALMMGSVAANAVETTVYVGYYDANNKKVSQKSYKADVTVNNDGSVTLADVLNSGKPITFSFDLLTEVGYQKEINLGGDYLLKETYEGYNDEYYYLMECKSDEYKYDADGYIDEECYATCTSTNKATDENPTEEVTTIYYPYLMGGDSYAYYYGTEAEKHADEYRLDFFVYGGSANDEGFYQLYFYFKAPEIVATDPVVPGDDVSANAVVMQPVLYVNGNWAYLDDMFSEITEDENYLTIADFLGSGKPLEFKKATDEKYIDGNKTRLQITQTNNVKVDGTTYRYLEVDGERYKFNMTAGETAYSTVRARYILNIKNSYLEEYSDDDAVKNGYRYHGYFDLRVVLASDEEPVDGDTNVETWLDLDFYFGEVEVQELELVGTEDINVYTYVANGNEWVDYAKPHQTQLEKYAGDEVAVYKIKNFLGSENDVDFSFVEPKSGEETVISISQSYLFDGDTYPYFYANDDYFTSKLNSLEGDETLSLDWLYYDSSSAVVYKYTDEEAALYNAQYNCSIVFVGYETEGWSNWMNLSFDFGSLGENSGVSNVMDDSNAPVEFYNLNGMRVENPSNGIFIRKQGNKTNKVVVR